MKLNEWAKEKGISLTEAKEITGLNHHRCIVPDEFIDSSEIVPEVEKKKEPKKSALPEGVTPQDIWFAVRGIGPKSELYQYRELAKAPKNYRGS